MDQPGEWTHQNDALHRSYRFRDFSTAFAFLTRVALHAERSTTIPSSPVSGTGSTSA